MQNSCNYLYSIFCIFCIRKTFHILYWVTLIYGMHNVCTYVYMYVHTLAYEHHVAFLFTASITVETEHMEIAKYSLKIHDGKWGCFHTFLWAELSPRLRWEDESHFTTFSASRVINFIQTYQKKRKIFHDASVGVYSGRNICVFTIMFWVNFPFFRPSQNFRPVLKSSTE